MKIRMIRKQLIQDENIGTFFILKQRRCHLHPGGYDDIDEAQISVFPVKEQHKTKRNGGCAIFYGHTVWQAFERFTAWAKAGYWEGE